MIIFRRRLLFWLIKAYIKRWGKIIIFSFIGGLIIFFVLLSTSRALVQVLPIEKKTIVGIIGTPKVDSLPGDIEQKISLGLTIVGKNGSITPGAASSWKIEESGKKYTFLLNKNKIFSNGIRLDSDAIAYDFADVKIEKPNHQTIVFTLKDAYAPFLVTVSRPIYKRGLLGVGEYTVRDVDLNGDFIKSITLVARKNKFKAEKYIFYPSEEALKVAFTLGEITKAVGLSDTRLKNLSFNAFPNVNVEKKTNYNKLVTVFYNTQDQLLSDKKLRNGLSYALPNVFSQGERAYVSYPRHSQYFNAEQDTRKQDFEHAKVLVNASANANGGAGLSVRLKTRKKYGDVAEAVAKSWKKIGVSTTIEEVDSVPDSFQAYLGDFNLPEDPDQYTLWHSDQSNNITKYKNLRIDKLLEDGRRLTDVKKRKEIYNDFQKYLLDDSPASFLYFPYEYDVNKK